MTWKLHSTHETTQQGFRERKKEREGERERDQLGLSLLLMSLFHQVINL